MLNKKQEAGKKVIDAMGDLSNGECIEVLAACAVSMMSAGAEHMGLTGLNASIFTMMCVTTFKAMVDTIAAEVTAEQNAAV